MFSFCSLCALKLNVNGDSPGSDCEGVVGFSVPVKSRSAGGDRRQFRAEPADLGDAGQNPACDLRLKTCFQHWGQ